MLIKAYVRIYTQLKLLLLILKQSDIAKENFLPFGLCVCLKRTVQLIQILWTREFGLLITDCNFWYLIALTTLVGTIIFELVCQMFIINYLCGLLLLLIIKKIKIYQINNVRIIYLSTGVMQWFLINCKI